MSQEISIRPFETGDAGCTSRLILDNLSLVNVRDYGEATVRELARYYTPEWLLEFAHSQNIFVAVDPTGVVGTATLDQERVRNVFVRIDRQRQGIGKILMGHVESFAARQGKKRLFLWANIAAVGFYQGLGYAGAKK